LRFHELGGFARDDFEGIIIGEGALYKNFFNARADDINNLSPSRRKKVFQHLDKQVFGSDLEDGRKEIERQMVFNRTKQRELERLAQKESDGGGSGSGSQEMDEEDEEEAQGDDEDGEDVDMDEGADASQGNKGDELTRKANDLVRLALFTEHKRTPLRREDINKKGVSPWEEQDLTILIITTSPGHECAFVQYDL